MKKVCALRAKTYTYLMDHHHNVYTEEVNKIALNSNDNKKTVNI